MRTRILSICILLACFVSSCELVEFQKEELQPVSKQLFIVVNDESSSVHQSGENQKKEKRQLKKLLNGYLQANTDIALMKINSHSADRTNTSWLYYKAPKRLQSNRVQSTKQQELEQVMYEASVKSTLKKMARKALKQLYLDTQPSNQTAIIELFQDRIAPICEKDTYDHIRIVILSDMIQESKQRNFTIPSSSWPMPDKDFAVRLAKKDSVSFSAKGYQMNLSKIASINIITPNVASNAKYFVAMPYYWDTFLSMHGYTGYVHWEKI